MFSQYQTLDGIISSGGLSTIREELNTYPLYLHTVRLFGFQEIGLIAVNKDGESHYASLHDETGRIIEIREEFTNPSIIVKVKEKTLMAILHEAERVKEHPVRALAKYAFDFHLVKGSYRNIPSYVAQVLRHMKKWGH